MISFFKKIKKLKEYSFGKASNFIKTKSLETKLGKIRELKEFLLDKAGNLIRKENLQKISFSAKIKDFTESTPENEEEVRYKATPKWTKSLQWAIVGVTGFGILYTCIAKIDEVVIAQGDLQSSGAERPIKAPISGIVSSIPVREGQLVESGQIILEFNTELSQETEKSLLKQIELETAKLNEEVNLYKARKIIIDSSLKKNKKLLNNENYILEKYVVLKDEGAVSELNVIEQKNKIINLENNILSDEGRLEENESEYKKNSQQIRRELSSLERQLFESNKSREYETFKSPIKGYIFDLIPSSPGYSASSGEVLLKIVPIGRLEAKGFVTNADIGFLKKDMKAEVRVNAFPFTQFGNIEGKLKLIGKEAIKPDQLNPEPRFPVIVDLSQQYLERKGIKYPVKAGQTVSINFVVRNKPVISLLSDALEKAIDSLKGIKTDPP